MNKLVGIKKMILVLVLALGFPFVNLQACAESALPSAARHTEQSVVENQAAPEDDRPIQLHFIMISCLFLVGGALGMVLLNTTSNDAESREE